MMKHGYPILLLVLLIAAAYGNYSFTNLTLSAFTVRADALDHTPQNKAVNLTTPNQTANFALVRIGTCVPVELC